MTFASSWESAPIVHRNQLAVKSSQNSSQLFHALLGDIYMRRARFTDVRTGFEKALNSFYLYDIPARVYNRVAAEEALALAKAVAAQVNAWFTYDHTGHSR